MADASTFQLDLPRDWTLWHAYKRHESPNPQYCDCQFKSDKCDFRFGDLEVHWDHKLLRYILHDPMDEPGYQEATAFPSRKPNIDVFGPPSHRSRKQRGWYQVRAWPPRPQPQTFSSDDRHFLLLAEVLPQELIRRILDHCIINGQLSGNARGELARCGQVCRFWADHCRITLFATLSLISENDMLDLRDFQDDDRCLFLPYLDEIVIAQENLTEPPWTHTFIPIWHEGNFVRVELQGPLPPGLRTLRSVHTTLPRSLPRHFCGLIREVDLFDIHLRRFHDLIHLMGELPDLSAIRCTRVTWSDRPGELPHRRPTIALNQLSLWKLIKCSPVDPTLAIFPYLHAYPRISFFSENDIPLIMTLLNQFLGHDTQDDLDISYIAPVHHENQGTKFIRLCVYTTLYIKSEIQSGGRPTEDVLEYKVTAICVDLSQAADISWPKFDAAANAFPFLRRVIFGFPRRQTLLDFMQKVAKRQLPLLSGRGLVKYAIGPIGSYPRRTLWYPLSQDTYEVKEPGTSIIDELYG